MAYDVGDEVTLSVTFKDSAGTATDPTAVTLTITLPDGTTTTPTPTHAATGVYTSALTLSQAGRWIAHWAGTGTVVEVDETVLNVMDAGSALIGLAAAKDFLSINTTDSDDLLRVYIDAVSQAIESYTGRTFRQQTFVETYTADGPTIALRHFPVISVTTVVEWSTTLSSDSYTCQTEQGLLTRTFGSRYPFVWWPGYQQVVVTYVAGYTNPPADVVHAAKVLLMHLWSTQRGSMGLGRGVVADDYGSPLSYSLPRRVTELLDAYRAPSVA